MICCAICGAGSDAEGGLCQDDDGQWYCSPHWKSHSMRARTKQAIREAAVAETTAEEKAIRRHLRRGGVPRRLVRVFSAQRYYVYEREIERGRYFYRQDFRAGGPDGVEDVGDPQACDEPEAQ